MPDVFSTEETPAEETHFCPDDESGSRVPPVGRRWWFLLPIDYGVYLLAVAFFAIFAAVFVSDGDQSEWVVCYVRAAERMLAHETIHRIEPVAYTYPPAMAMLAVPLAVLPGEAPLWTWYLVNVAAGLVVFGCAWRLAGGPSLVRLSLRWTIIFWLGVILAVRFFVAPLENQQTDMLIAALIFGGCLLLCSGRDLSAAVSLGMATAMKCTPLLFAPYLLWRGKWKSAVVLVAVAMGLNLLPDVIFPQLSGRSYLADWSGSFLGEVGRSAPGVWFSDILLNQSLAGLFNRYAQLGFPVTASALEARWSESAEAGVGGLRALVYGCGLLLVGLTFWRFARPGKSVTTLEQQARRPLPLASLAVGAEAAAVVCLMLLLSPMSSKAHYVVLLLPALLLARVAVERPSVSVWLLTIVLLLTGPLTAKGLIGKAWGDLTLAWGVPTWHVLACLLAMWIVLGIIHAGPISSVFSDRNMAEKALPRAPGRYEKSADCPAPVRSGTSF